MRSSRPPTAQPITEDTVSSSWLVRGRDGKEYKPQDYLTAFSQIVRENPAEVEAIRILLSRPRDWSTKALTELQQKLATAPQRFTLDHLRKAHELHYHKALIDIISMVKHAANEEQPLYTASERVQLAIVTTRHFPSLPMTHGWPAPFTLPYSYKRPIKGRVITRDSHFWFSTRTRLKQTH